MVAASWLAITSVGRCQSLRPHWPVLRARTPLLVSGRRYLLGVVLAAGCSVHAGSSSVTYEVIAPLLAEPRGRVYACYSIAESDPFGACSGVVVRGVDIRRVPSVHHDASGSMWTPSVRLAGTWDGQALTVTKPVRPATPVRTSWLPPCNATVDSATDPGVLAVEERIARDSPALKQRGVLVLSITRCGNRVDIVVAVADPPTVSYVDRRYGPVNIVGWLQPL